PDVEAGFHLARAPARNSIRVAPRLLPGIETLAWLPTATGPDAGAGPRRALRGYRPSLAGREPHRAGRPIAAPGGRVKGGGSPHPLGHGQNCRWHGPGSDLLGGP